MSTLETRYLEYHDVSPNKLDIFTLMIAVSLVVGIALMVYWLLAAFMRPLTEDFEEFSEESGRRSSAAREPYFLDEFSSNEPTEVVIERPLEHDIGHRDRRSRAINSQSDTPTTETAPSYTQGNEENPPVLNVVWKPSGATAMSKEDVKPMKMDGSGELITSIPLYLKKITGRGLKQKVEHICQTLSVNLFLEPIPYGQEGKEPFSDIQDSTYQPSGIPISNSTVPSITLTTTTTKTTVSKPGPGFTKRVTDTRTMTKQVTKEPLHQFDGVVPTSSGSDAEEAEECSSSLRTAVEVPLNALKTEKRFTSSTASTQAVPSSPVPSAPPSHASLKQPATTGPPAIHHTMKPTSCSLTENQEAHPDAFSTKSTSEFKAKGGASGLGECLEGHLSHAEAKQENQAVPCPPIAIPTPELGSTRPLASSSEAVSRHSLPHSSAKKHRDSNFDGTVLKAAKKASSKPLGLSEHSRSQSQQMKQVQPIPAVAPAIEPEPTHQQPCSSDAAKHLSLPITSEEHEHDPSTARTATKSTKKSKSKPIGSSECAGKLKSRENRVQSTLAAASTKKQESTHSLPYSSCATAERSTGALPESVKKASSKPKQGNDPNTSAVLPKSVNKDSNKPSGSSEYSERTLQFQQVNQAQLEPEPNQKASSHPSGSSEYSRKPHLQQNQVQIDQPHSSWMTSDHPSLPHTSAERESGPGAVVVMPKSKSPGTGGSQISGSNEHHGKPQSGSSTEKTCPPAAVENSSLNRNDLAQPSSDASAKAPSLIQHQSNQPTTTNSVTVGNQEVHHAATSTNETSPRNMDITQSSHSCAVVQNKVSGDQQPTTVTKTIKETITDTQFLVKRMKENLPNASEETAVQASDSRKPIVLEDGRTQPFVAGVVPQSDTGQQQSEIMTTTKEVVTDTQTRVTTLSEPLPGASSATPTSQQNLHREHNSGTDGLTKPNLSQPQTNISNQLTSGNVTAAENLNSSQPSEAGVHSQTGAQDQQQPVAKKTITEVVTDTECIVTTLKEKNQPVSDSTAASEDNTQPSPGPLPHTEALDQNHKEIKINCELASDTHKKL